MIGFKNNIKMRATTFENRLVETGGQIITASTKYGQGYGRDAEFCYRWSSELVEIGIRQYFCRWANSRDFVLYRPIDKVDLDCLRFACHLAMDHGHCGYAWAISYDLGNYYRKARRMMGGRRNGQKEKRFRGSTRKIS